MKWLGSRNWNFLFQYLYFNIIFQISLGIKHSDPNFQLPVAKTEPVEYHIISCLHYFHTGFSKFMKNSYFCSDKVKYSGYGNPMWLKTKVNLFSVNWFKFMIIFHRTNCLRILNPYDVFGSLKSSILCYTQRSSLKIFYSKNKAKHHGKS